jgi:transposase
LRHTQSEEAPVGDDVTQALSGLDEFRVLTAVEVGDELHVTVETARSEAPCPGCGTFSARVKQRVVQRVRDGRSFERSTVLWWRKRRFRCNTPRCQASFTEATEQVPRRARVTTRLRDAMGRAGQARSTAEVAASYRVSWTTAWRAVTTVAEAVLADRPVSPRRLGLDETTFRRPQRFATGLIDLDTGRVWDLVAGRSRTVVAQRLSLLDDTARAAITDIVIDPFAGYKAAVRDRVPGARRTADRFHIVRLANKALTDVRCRRQQELTAHRGRKTDPFYRARRDLLRSRHRLTDRHVTRLQAAFAADPADELYCAWVAKEALADLYREPNRRSAAKALDEWRTLFGGSGIPELARLATTLGRWSEEILNYFDSRLTNGRTEGRNLTIKTVKRSGHGFRNFDNYRLRVLYRCG